VVVGLILYFSRFMSSKHNERVTSQAGLEDHSSVRNSLYGRVTSWNGSRVVSR
jgi:hypothetical protein